MFTTIARAKPVLQDDLHPWKLMTLALGLQAPDGDIPNRLSVGPSA